MITKEQLIESMRHETNVIKHLAARVPEGSHDYRPTEGQRSMLELLRYMTRMAIVPTVWSVTGTWDHAEAFEREAENSTVDAFPEEMDKQMSMIEEVLGDVDPEEATTKESKMPWGAPTTLAAGLMDMTLKCFVAYRMQLFLYVKACGVSDIGPANCWAGVDMPEAEGTTG